MGMEVLQWRNIWRVFGCRSASRVPELVWWEAPSTPHFGIGRQTRSCRCGIPTLEPLRWVRSDLNGFRMLRGVPALFASGSCGVQDLPPRRWPQGAPEIPTGTGRLHHKISNHANQGRRVNQPMMPSDQPWGDATDPERFTPSWAASCHPPMTNQDLHGGPRRGIQPWYLGLCVPGGGIFPLLGHSSLTSRHSDF